MSAMSAAALSVVAAWVPKTSNEPLEPKLSNTTQHLLLLHVQMRSGPTISPLIGWFVTQTN